MPKNKETFNNFCYSHCQSQVGSFREAIQTVREQIEIESFVKENLPQVEEITLIIAEVMMLHPESLIQINGNKLPAELVQEIYGQLTKEHIDLVLDNFKTVKYRIRHIKTYLRTALYNSVFEFESKYENEFLNDNNY